MGGLHTDRLNADYNLVKRQVETIGYARVRVVAARRIQNLIEACDCDEAREQIKAGIAEYERRISGK